jgi:RNA-directed DNA polymerase
MNAIRSRIRGLTARQRRAGMKDVREVIRDLNPVLRGWGNYFRSVNASLKFQQVDRYVYQRLVALLRRRGGKQRDGFRASEWTIQRFVSDHNLHRLIGTIRHPGSAHAA